MIHIVNPLLSFSTVQIVFVWNFNLKSFKISNSSPLPQRQNQHHIEYNHENNWYQHHKYCIDLWCIPHQRLHQLGIRVRFVSKPSFRVDFNTRHVVLCSIAEEFLSTRMTDVVVWCEDECGHHDYCDDVSRCEELKIIFNILYLCGHPDKRYTDGTRKADKSQNWTQTPTDGHHSFSFYSLFNTHKFLLLPVSSLTADTWWWLTVPDISQIPTWNRITSLTSQ